MARPAGHRWPAPTRVPPDTALTKYALIDGTSELGRAWLACWQEQLAEGMELAREALERQGTFARSSLERLNAQAARSAEVTSGMVDGYLAPLRESTGGAAGRVTRPSA